MKRWKCLVALFLIVVVFSSCADPQQGAVGGGLLGAGIGAIIGGALGDPGLGAAIGGAVGTMAGAAAGAENQRRFCEMNQAKLDLLPNDWKSPDGQLANDQNGRLCYFLGNDHLAWNQTNQAWEAED